MSSDTRSNIDDEATVWDGSEEYIWTQDELRNHCEYDDREMREEFWSQNLEIRDHLAQQNALMLCSHKGSCARCYIGYF